MLGSASIPFRAPLMSAMVPLVRGAPLPARVRGAVPRRVILRASEPAATAASTKAAERDPAALFRDYDVVCDNLARAPPSMKTDPELLGDVRKALTALSEAGLVPMFGSAAGSLQRRNVFLGELKRVGIKDPESLATPSVRNDAAFLVTVFVVFSGLGVVAGNTLPGDFSFFVPYLLGGVPLLVLAIGSVSPGLLQAAIDSFRTVFPDYRERVLRHEAGHYLVGYLLGVPVAGYTLALGKEHTDFAEARLSRRLIEGKLSDDELNALAVVAMAGLAAEGLEYEEVLGQTADLMLLQRLMMRAETKLTDQQQQNLTRWATFEATRMLKEQGPAYERLMAAMRRGGSVRECLEAIEGRS